MVIPQQELAARSPHGARLRSALAFLDDAKLVQQDEDDSFAATPLSCDASCFIAVGLVRGRNSLPENSAYPCSRRERVRCG
jgi:hypothetical protein